MDLRSLRYFIAVAEERHVGRAAARLHMTQPPLSRAIKDLEAELGARLLDRGPTGVTPTAAGVVLLGEAVAVLERADRVRDRVAGAAGTSTLRLGVLADSAGQLGTRLVAAFHRKHPHVQVHLHEADFADPSAGLRAGRVDVAITRLSFDTAGLRTYTVRTEPLGVVLRADDPLAACPGLRLGELADRPWFRLPEGTDPQWAAAWHADATADQEMAGPVVRTITECLQAVLWNGTVGLTSLTHPLPPGLVAVPLVDASPSTVVVAHPAAASDPLVTSFVRIALAAHRRGPAAGTWA